MKPIAQWQALRGVDTPCVCYVRDSDGAVDLTDKEVTVEVAPYMHMGGPVVERAPGTGDGAGRLEWTVSANTKMVPGLYCAVARVDGRALALGLLEVV